MPQNQAAIWAKLWRNDPTWPYPLDGVGGGRLLWLLPAGRLYEDTCPAKDLIMSLQDANRIDCVCVISHG